MIFESSQNDRTFHCDCQKKVRSNKKIIFVSSQNDRTLFCDCQKKVRSNLKILFLKDLKNDRTFFGD